MESQITYHEDVWRYSFQFCKYLFSSLKYIYIFATYCINLDSSHVWQFGRNRIDPDGREQIKILMICLEGLYNYYMYYMFVHVSSNKLYVGSIYLPLNVWVTYFRHYRVKPGHGFPTSRTWSDSSLIVLLILMEMLIITV